MSAVPIVQVHAQLDAIESPTVVAYELREEIARPFELTVSLLGPRDTDVDMLLGADLTFVLKRESAVVEERTVGVIAEVALEDDPRASGDSDTHARFTLRVQPALALLDLERNSRIFQDKTVPEIAQEVLERGLARYGRAVEAALDHSYAKREYCVQYEESDLAFVHRLLEEEGIHYLFDHGGRREVLRLTDRNATFGDVGTTRYQPHDLVAREEERIRDFHPAKRASMTHVQLRDYDFETAASPAEGERGADDADFGGERREYDHGLDRRMDATSLAQRAAIRHEAHAIAAAEHRGVSEALRLRAGRVFELSGCPIVGADAKYVVTRVVHRNADTSSSAAELYTAEFWCAPFELPFRAKRATPRPHVDGIETATVVGPPGEEIHADEHGRVKVQFPWDRVGRLDEHSSCWLRVEQPWAGDGWGWMFVPRVGMEVVVQFVDGNPDRPLVTGCLYNGENMPPYALPDERTKSTFKTQSSIGGNGFNEFRFEDRVGNEQIFIHAQRNFDEVVLGNHTTDVGHDQKNTVGGDQTQTIDGDQDETVSGDQGLLVNSHRTIHVRSNVDEKIDGGETRTVLGDSKETFDALEERLVVGGITETIVGAEQHIVTGNKLEVISGDHAQNVVGSAEESVSRISRTNAIAGIEVMCAHARVHGGAGFVATVGSSTSVFATSNLNIRATTLFDINTTYAQTGTTSVSLHAAKTETVVLKAEFTTTKVDTYVFQLAMGGIKSSITGAKLMVSKTRMEGVGTLIYQGRMSNIRAGSIVVL